MPMRLASSCRVFELLSTTLEWVSGNKLNIPRIIHILDDYLIAAESLDHCKTHLQHILRMWGRLWPQTVQRTLIRFCLLPENSRIAVKMNNNNKTTLRAHSFPIYKLHQYLKIVQITKNNKSNKREAFSIKTTM